MPQEVPREANWRDQRVAEVAARGLASEPVRWDRLCLTKALAQCLPAESLLDAGCGPGELYPLIRSRVRWYTGVDVSPAMTQGHPAIANSEESADRLVVGDVRDLHGLDGFEDHGFDVVACFAVMGHLPEWEPALRELWRVTKRVLLFNIWPGAGPGSTMHVPFHEGVPFPHFRHATVDVLATSRTLTPRVEAETVPSGMGMLLLRLTRGLDPLPPLRDAWAPAPRATD